MESNNKYLIRKVNEDYKVRFNENMVFYSPDKKDFSMNVSDFKAGMFMSLIKKPVIHCYAVNLSEELVGESDKISIGDFSDDKYVDLKAHFELKVRPDAMFKAVETYMNNSDLLTLTKYYIKDWIKKYNKEYKLWEDPNGHRIRLQNYISEMAEMSNFGFELISRVTILDFFAHRLTINSSFFPVRLKDKKGEINIKFDTEAILITDHKEQARHSKFADANELENLIKELLKNYFLESVSKDNYFKSKYQQGILPKELLAYLNENLVSQGRRLSYFELEDKNPTGESTPERIVSLPVEVECKIKQGTQFIKVKVSNEVKMELKDEGKAVLGGINSQSDLEKWAVKNIDEIVKGEYLEISDFADLVIDFFDNDNSLKDKIGKKLKKRAKEIGYKVRYYNVLPVLSGFEDKRIKIQKDDVEFKTKGGDIPLYLSFDLQGVIEKWAPVRKYLMPGADLRGKITEKAIDTIKEIVQRNYPERLYMHFYDSVDGQESIEKLLIRGIESAMRDFNLQDLSIGLFPAKSDIKTRFFKVVNKPFKVTTEFKSLKSDALPESIHYHFGFQIIGIDKDNAGFNKFYSSKDIDLDFWKQQISDVLESELISYLQTLEVVFVKYEHDKIRHHLEKQFKDEYAIPKIKQVFGLEIDVYEFRRDLTEEELDEAKTGSHLIAKTGEAKRNEITNALKAPDNALELKRIDARIKEITQFGVFKTPEQEEELNRLKEKREKVQNQTSDVLAEYKAKRAQQKASKMDALQLLAQKQMELKSGKEEKKPDHEMDNNS